MSQIDCITAILAIPAVEETGELRDALPGDAVLEEHFAVVAERFSRLNHSDGEQKSRIDEILEEFLGQAVASHRVDLTHYEKKGKVYPAIVFHTSGISTETGEPLADAITKRFREESARNDLASLLGPALSVDWVSVYTTFGPSGREADGSD